jgi:Serine/threonine protein kinase
LLDGAKALRFEGDANGLSGLYDVNHNVSAREGEHGKVLQLIREDGGHLYALKVFHALYRHPFLEEQTEKLRSLSRLNGLGVCNRRIVTPSSDRLLISDHPELLYAVIMPWIDGVTWEAMLRHKEPLSESDCESLARSFLKVLLTLEQEGIAHCHLSASNLMVLNDQSVQLLDVEHLSAGEMSKPFYPSKGASGYRPVYAEDSIWNSLGDRFAGGVLLMEMLTWSDSRIRDKAWGDAYFNSEELQTNGERLDLIEEVLMQRYGHSAVLLMKRLWNSRDWPECPSFAEWFDVLFNKPSEKEDSAAGDGTNVLVYEQDLTQDSSKASASDGSIRRGAAADETRPIAVEEATAIEARNSDAAAKPQSNDKPSERPISFIGRHYHLLWVGGWSLVAFSIFISMLSYLIHILI